MKMRCKKAQFYIIAAVIIAVVLIGLFTSKNYIRVRPKDVKFYDLGKELGLESGYVIDYGIYNSAQQDIDVLIDSWLSEYVDYSKTVTGVGEWIFVYGDETEMTALVFTNESSGNIYIDIGGDSSSVSIPGGQKHSSIFTPQENEIMITSPDGSEYQITLNPGENFFFILSKEGYVTTPKIKG